MTAMIQTPASPLERFSLSVDRSHARKPWSRSGAILAALARPTWTAHHVARLERIADRFYDSDRHVCVPGYTECMYCDIPETIRAALKEWRRIKRSSDRLVW